MRFARVRDTIALVAALSVLLSAGPAHALTCLVGEAHDVGAPAEAPCHAPGHPAAPASDGAPAPSDTPPDAPSMSCCVVPAGVMRALENPAPASAAVLVPRVQEAIAEPSVLAVGTRAFRPPAPPGPLHLLYGCFLT